MTKVLLLECDGIVAEVITSILERSVEVSRKKIKKYLISIPIF